MNNNDQETSACTPYPWRGLAEDTPGFITASRHGAHVIKFFLSIFWPIPPAYRSNQPDDLPAVLQALRRNG